MLRDILGPNGAKEDQAGKTAYLGGTGLVYQILLGLQIEEERGGAGHMAGMGKRIDACKSLVRNSGRKSPLGRPRHWREDDIEIYLKSVGKA
jgi:hypothetical protein